MQLEKIYIKLLPLHWHCLMHKFILEVGHLVSMDRVGLSYVIVEAVTRTGGVTGRCVLVAEACVDTFSKTNVANVTRSLDAPFLLTTDLSSVVCLHPIVAVSLPLLLVSFD